MSILSEAFWCAQELTKHVRKIRYRRLPSVFQVDVDILRLGWIDSAQNLPALVNAKWVKKQRLLEGSFISMIDNMCNELDIDVP
ncbi:hypothetical protein RC74_17735 [Falsihalocynthiibacter arcticus]|uniref:Uncharacterized protein n=1 Tax=Falsihalocynthiibacter arcticus TaxID=1579316 RepID=A0A126V3I4_9RHOB|nr:hypothetical protein RC74_17735 [Falsihalocynthiibacter arcticus]